MNLLKPISKSERRMKTAYVNLATTLMVWAAKAAPAERLENHTHKTVLVFTSHPAVETFAVGGTMASLAKSRNQFVGVIYTSDNKGSYDQDRTSERLARIRKAAGEASCAVLGSAATAICEASRDRLPFRHEHQVPLRHGRNIFHHHGCNLTAR